MASHADLVDCAKRGFAEDISTAIKGGADVNKRDEGDIGAGRPRGAGAGAARGRRG